MFKYYNYGGNLSEDRFMEYANTAIRKTPINIGRKVEPGDYLITLSTCLDFTDNGRFVVVARKVSKEVAEDYAPEEE